MDLLQKQFDTEFVMKPEKRDYKVWQVDNPEYEEYFGEENFNQDIFRQICNQYKRQTEAQRNLDEEKPKQLQIEVDLNNLDPLFKMKLAIGRYIGQDGDRNDEIWNEYQQ